MNNVILTGLRANADLTLGNYLGAIVPMVDMARTKADDYRIHMFVPDLHSLTTPITYTELQSQVINNVRIYAAAGLQFDHSNIHIYRQSRISEHSELTWILNCFTGYGEMQRMTEFKDKAANLNENRISVGLFNYPVLMAADILLYDASYVPIGEDQRQHLEFTRDIAQRMNNQFGEIFAVPKSVKEQYAFAGRDSGLRIKDLQDPAKKMSKSDALGKGVIFLGDSPEVAYKKIMSATTDNFAKIANDPIKQPGISNLLDIYTLLGGDATEFIGQTQYGAFKEAVANSVSNFLQAFQVALAAVDDQMIIDKLETSETVMKVLAGQKLHLVQQAVGLRK